MKRFWSLVLIVIMMTALGGTAGAGSGCPHWYFDEVDLCVYLYKKGDFINIRDQYTPYGDEHHTHTRYGQYICTKCGELAEDYLGQRGGSYECTFIDGVCTYCGNVQAH